MFWENKQSKCVEARAGPRGSRVATLGAVVFSPERAMWIRAEGFGFRV